MSLPAPDAFSERQAEVVPSTTKPFDPRALADALARMADDDVYADDATLVARAGVSFRPTGPLATDDDITLEAQAPVVPPGVPSPLGDDEDEEATVRSGATPQLGPLESFTLEDLGFGEDELLAGVPAEPIAAASVREA